MKKYLVLPLFVFILYFGCAKQHYNYSFLQNIQREKFGNANAVIVFDTTSVSLENTGNYVESQHKLVKILSMKGKADYSEASFGYYLSYDTVIVELARVITPDGKVINVPKEDIKDVKIPAFGKFFLPNVRMKKITFPDIVEGSSVEYVMKDIMRNPPMENNFDDMVLFEDMNPILSKVYVISSPMKLKWKVKNDNENIVKFTEEKKKNNTVYKWYASNVPGIVREPLMPPRTDVSKKLLVSSVPSWKVWSRWYYDLCKDKFATNDTMNIVIDSVLAGKKSREDSIRALYYYVSKNIRYVATTMSGKKGGYEPFPAIKTFRDKYGVCRDKAALLTAMLRKAGFEAYTVLTNPIAYVEKDVPVDQFNHAITAVRNRDRSFLFIDPTAEHTVDFLPGYEQGKGVLVCDEKGEDLAYLPTIPAKNNLLFIENKSEIDDQGNLKGTMAFRMKGLMDMSFRGMLLYYPPERIKQIFQQIIKGISTDAVLDTFYYSDPNDFYKPLEITLNFHSPDYALITGRIMTFHPAMMGGAGISTMMGGGRNPFALDKRKYPLFLFSTMATILEGSIKIPMGYKVKMLPEGYKEGLGFFTGISSYKKGKGYINYKAESDFNKFLISPQEYTKLKQVVDKLTKLGKQEIVLEK